MLSVFATYLYDSDCLSKIFTLDVKTVEHINPSDAIATPKKPVKLRHVNISITITERLTKLEKKIFEMGLKKFKVVKFAFLPEIFLLLRYVDVFSAIYLERIPTDAVINKL